MRRKYLLGPFLCFLATWTCGNGLLPLLPLYAMERGASQAASGLFLAFAYLCIALGTMAAGTLPRTFRHRRLLLVACGIPQLPLVWLGGHVANALQLAIVTGVSWFLGGVIQSQAATIVGLAAKPEDRGTSFGILGMTNGLGSLIGGLGVGYLADQFGYRGVFNSLAAFSILFVVGGLLSIEAPASPAEPAHEAAPGERRIGRVLILLLIAQLLLAVTIGPGNLGRSLSMNAGGFSKFAISLTAAIQGSVTLGFVLVMGWLSDKVGRKWVLIASCAAITASLLLLGFSRALWQFCVFAVLYSFLGLPPSVGPAYVVDVDPTGNVGRNVSLVQSAFWVGCIAGMACTGYAIERLGMGIAILVSASFPVVAVILLLLIKGKVRPSGVSTPQS
jgi:MFS family permease